MSAFYRRQLSPRFSSRGESARFTLVFYCVLTLWGSHAWPHASLDSSWKAALETKRSDALESWMRAAEALGIEAPEAHHNLGVLYWNEGKKGAAVFQVLRSAALQSSPSGIFRELETLSSFERELGVRDGLSASPAFALYHFLNEDYLLIFASLTFWLLVGYGYLRWVKPKGLQPAKDMLLVTHLCFLLLTVSSYGYRHFNGSYAVLLDDTAPIPLFKKADDPDTKKLADLPSGTIVQVTESSAERTRIAHPVAGWVPSAQLKSVN